MVCDRENRHGDQVLIITDCVRFQELLLCSKLIFLGGMAEAKSKGRGEECISQNLRIICGPNGKRVILFFANSQRREHKRYVSIPRKYSYHSRMGPARSRFMANWAVNCIGGIKPPKKPGRPVTLELNPNFEILVLMKTLTIQFLDDYGQCNFEFYSRDLE